MKEGKRISPLQIFLGQFKGLIIWILIVASLQAKQNPDMTINHQLSDSTSPAELATHAVRAIGYRVVHGGPRYREPQRVDEAMLVELRRISSFAPNHLPKRTKSTVGFYPIVCLSPPS